MIKTVVIGLAGTGWAGAMHAKSYRKLCGINCRMKTVCSLDTDREEFAAQFGFEQTTACFEEMLEDSEIEIIDIATPPSLHYKMAEAALKAGKHVICEKPVTGYFGNSSVKKDETGNVPKDIMLNAVREELNRLELVVKNSGCQFFYAENWIYSPSFIRMAELVVKKGTKLLSIEARTGHKGSHAEHAAFWCYNGGGALIRQGTHPVAAVLFLKRKEMEARGEVYGITSVLCDTSSLTKKTGERGEISSAPVDVEDWSQLIITFSDGSKASVTAGDIFLGGIINCMTVYGTDSVYQCNMTPNDLLEVYWGSETGIEEEEVMEKSGRNLGYQKALVQEEMLRGYTGQLQDFVECAATGRKPESDYRLAKETLLVIYAGYCSAEWGDRFMFDNHYF